MSVNSRSPLFDAYYTLYFRNQNATKQHEIKLQQIWNTVSNQGLKSACYFWPGSDVNITRYPDYYYKYDGSVPNEERMLQALRWLDLPVDQRYLFFLLQ